MVSQYLAQSLLKQMGGAVVFAGKSAVVGTYRQSHVFSHLEHAFCHNAHMAYLAALKVYGVFNLKGAVFIGDNTCIGGNAKILDNDFHPIEWETRNRLLNDPNGGDSDLIPAKPIVIGKNCFIGCNSIILKGTILGDGCVIGAGAVVSGKFESNSVIAGNPARVIKKLEG